MKRVTRTGIYAMFLLSKLLQVLYIILLSLVDVGIC